MWKIIQSSFTAQKEKEEEIPTTLKLLKEMTKIEKKTVDPIRQTEYHGTIGDEIYFEHKDITFVDKVALSSIRYSHKDGHGYHQWRASAREYRQVYERNDVWGSFVGKELTSMVTYLDERKHEAFYRYIIDQHYPQVLLVSECIREIEVLENYVPDDVAQKCITLLRGLFTEIKELKGQYRKDILRKLNDEIQYLDERSQLRIVQKEEKTTDNVMSS